MSTKSDAVTLVWLRNDLRVHDHPALSQAAQRGAPLEVVYIHDARCRQPVEWGFPRAGTRRLAWVRTNLLRLQAELAHLGHTLHILHGDPCTLLLNRLAQGGVGLICYHEEPGVEEQADAVRLRKAAEALGIPCANHSGGDLFAPDIAGHLLDHKGEGFTPFRQKLEQGRYRPREPLPVPDLRRCRAVSASDIVGLWEPVATTDAANAGGRLPSVPQPLGEPDPWPLDWEGNTDLARDISSAKECLNPDTTRGKTEEDPENGRGDFIWRGGETEGDPENGRGDFTWQGGETAALARLQDYFYTQRHLPNYKETRNGMLGSEFSTRFSPWLAVGALSPALIWQESLRYESNYGRNDGSEWLRFELLWREYFRLLSRRWGSRLFRAGGGGPGAHPNPRPAGLAFERWCNGQTGHPFIDAQMTELAATGWMSNRGRQVVASYLVHQLTVDWRAGAAWFEHHLIDYDVCSNYGNWTYVAGVGTDPRPNRVFNPDLQAKRYDPTGAYVRKWLGR